MAVSRGLAPLWRRVAESQDEALAARTRPASELRLAAFHTALARRHAARDRRALGWSVGTGLALGAAAAAMILWPRGGAPLSFVVGDPALPGEVGAWMAAPPASPVAIAFSDGTRVRLDAGTRARVVGSSAEGARVAIDRGAIRAEVVPRDGNDWSILGGPFEIHVTGTRFDAGWDPASEVLRVTMYEGRVVVRAACLDHERALTAGDAVSLSCAPPKAPVEGGPGPAPTVPHDTFGAVKPAPRAPSSPPSAPVSAAPEPSPEPPAPATVEAAALPPSWRELSRRGDYKGALAAAEADDWGALCQSLSAADLLELGTVARLGGRSARAVEVYSVVRRRFPGSDAAATAAFYLGRMAFDGAHALAESHRWFSTYLAERPGGALAVEALGRMMEAEQRLGDLAAARETATRYLARYPTGAHASLARSLQAP